jgi:hypothetical protein
MSTDMENQNVRLVVTFVIGLLVGLGVYWLFDRTAPQSDVATLEENTEEATSTMGDMVSLGDNGLVLGTQTAGKQVVFKEIALASPAWIAIQDDVNGQPGKTLGARLFDKGTTTGAIDLLRATEDGKEYLVVIHSTDGNKTFTSATDKALTDSSGNVLMTKFSVGNVESTTTSDDSTTTTDSSDTSSINLNSK